MQNDRKIPRWQQGLRPGAFGDVWDAMTPGERRGAFIGDLLIAFGGMGIVCWLFS
jgi:hypothetical protein